MRGILITILLLTSWTSMGQNKSNIDNQETYVIQKDTIGIDASIVRRPEQDLLVEYSDDSTIISVCPSDRTWTQPFIIYPAKAKVAPGKRAFAPPYSMAKSVIQAPVSIKYNGVYVDCVFSYGDMGCYKGTPYSISFVTLPEFFIFGDYSNLYYQYVYVNGVISRQVIVEHARDQKRDSQGTNELSAGEDIGVEEPKTKSVPPATLINENYIRMLTKPMSRVYLAVDDTLIKDAASEIITEKGRWTIVNKREDADFILDLRCRKISPADYEVSAKIIDPANDNRSIYETAVFGAIKERAIYGDQQVFRELYERIIHI